MLAFAQTQPSATVKWAAPSQHQDLPRCTVHFRVRGPNAGVTSQHSVPCPATDLPRITPISCDFEGHALQGHGMQPVDVHCCISLPRCPHAAHARPHRPAACSPACLLRAVHIHHRSTAVRVGQNRPWQSFLGSMHYPCLGAGIIKQ